MHREDDCPCHMCTCTCHETGQGFDETTSRGRVMFDRPGEFGPLFECVKAELFRPEVQCWIHHRLALYLIEEEDDAIVRLQRTKHHWQEAQAARKRLTERECKAAWEFVKLVIEDFEEFEELDNLVAYYAC